jgi:hypothetical protein
LTADFRFFRQVLHRQPRLADHERASPGQSHNRGGAGQDGEGGERRGGRVDYPSEARSKQLQNNFMVIRVQTVFFTASRMA